MQGLEKVMPQPVSREKQDTQVCCLMDGERAWELHTPDEQGVPDATRTVLGPAWFGLSPSSVKRTSPHDLLS